MRDKRVFWRRVMGCLLLFLVFMFVPEPLDVLGNILISIALPLLMPSLSQQ